ncbi:N-glycosylase/DNA lyase [Cryphonectria parasitica EP155]|uniref:DNA-(apurinic or apyrimidinic site) lyase n=1 Tax=Cryphonectria parasitica (strain ATCC 38755 / EP155) TaxID=660469 RepID=A0A9P4YB12_CRYP1|nr:N-glycosylase/DNA lyase [Cryphonectria parasitica EP155]KAF3769350.1 N-glycosylase/DNA lyase [Cryphonectria parasitica EP155]
MTLGKTEWRKLPLSLTELCIDTTLRCGQSFRWRQINNEWHCSLHGRILSLKQDPDHLHYRVTWPKIVAGPSTASTSLKVEEGAQGGRVPDDSEALLKNYFNLHHDLAGLYKQWANADQNFRKKAPGFTGVRILNQDAWEALVGFICSSNNNISRISQMVHKLCLNYGPYIGTIGEEVFHDFPTPITLASPGVESRLRELGFGYRAKYIAETARNISQDRPAGWLESLRNPDSKAWETVPQQVSLGDEPSTYKHAHEQLLELCGVGPKVADCVCLMGLGWGEAVPVDTHVWQIAMRDYRFGGKNKNKTLSKAMYDAVGDHFRNLWGSQAGWAHSVLFTADLKTFSGRVAQKLEDSSELMAVKIETKEESPAPGTSITTPASTPIKRKRTSVATTIKVHEEALSDSVATISVAPRKRIRTRK